MFSLSDTEVVLSRTGSNKRCTSINSLLVEDVMINHNKHHVSHQNNPTVDQESTNEIGRPVVQLLAAISGLMAAWVVACVGGLIKNYGIL